MRPPYPPRNRRVLIAGGCGAVFRSGQTAVRLPIIGIVSRGVMLRLLLGGCGAFFRSVQIVAGIGTASGYRMMLGMLPCSCRAVFGCV